MEYWKKRRTWNNGMLEYWVKRKDRKNGERKKWFLFYVFVLTHDSIIPVFHCSGILAFQYSNDSL